MTEEQKNPDKGADKDIDDNKVVAALSYAWILFLIPLLSKRDSKFCQFHAKQGLVLFLMELVGSLLFWFPLFGQLLMVAFVIVSILGIIKALNGEWWKIPYVHDWSKKFNI